MKILIVFILFGFGCTFIAVTFAEHDESQAEGQQYGRWSWNFYEKPNKHYSHQCCYNQTFEDQLIQALLNLSINCINADRAGFSGGLRDHVTNCLIQLLDFVNLDSCTYAPLLDFVDACADSTTSGLDDSSFAAALACAKPYIEAFYRCQYRCAVY